jgi:small subunit ribosomal protein S20
MPHTPSAEKRLRQSEKRRRRNRVVAKKIKDVRKDLIGTEKVISVAKVVVATKVGTDEATAAKAKMDAAMKETGDKAKAVQTLLDRAADKGYIHKNKAARLKSRMVKRLRTLDKPVAAK